MKKLNIFLIILFSTISISAENILSIIENPLPVELSEINAWACALPGIIDEMNRASHSTLEVEKLSNFNITVYKNMLVNYWNIKNRNNLLHSLEWLLTKGQNAEFNEYLNYFRANPDSTIDEIIEKYMLSEREFNGLKFIKSLNFAPDENTILAYDLGRYVAVCRWGYQCGYINNADAWTKILSVIPVIKKNFNSWEEFGKSYMHGRLFWLALSNDSETEKVLTEKIFKKLITPPKGYWTTIPWDFENGNLSLLQLEVGKMYLYGSGTKKDIEKSIMWLKKSENSGNAEAEKLLKKISNKK